MTGIGTSRILEVLAATDLNPDSLEWQCKLKAVEAFKKADPENSERQEFAKTILESLCIGITFNGISPRSDDVSVMMTDPKEALAMRFLWSYFCDTTSTPWSDFVKRLLVPGLELPQAISWVLAEHQPNTNIILCVDELMLVADGKPAQTLTQEVSLLLNSLAMITDKQPQAHIVMSSIQLNPIQHISTYSKRTFPRSRHYLIRIILMDDGYCQRAFELFESCDNGAKHISFVII